MAGRPIKYPCGTPQAYKRHKLKKEEPCEECQTAQERREMDRAIERSGIADFRENAEDSIDRLYVGPLVNENNMLDALADLRENYLLVREKMKNTGARDFAPLSKRREELLDRIVELQEALEPPKDQPKSLVDQLSERRAERLAKAAGE